MRTLFIGIVGLTVGIVGLTVWSLWSYWREYNIQSAILESGNPHLWWPRGWQEDFRIRKKLIEHVSLDFVSTPLGEVCTFLQEHTGIPIELDETFLEEAGISKQTPVTIQVEDVSLLTALNVLVGSIDYAATYFVEDHKLVITFQSVALAQHGDRYLTVNFWTKALEHKNPFVREDAAHELGRLGPEAKSAVLALEKVLNDIDSYVRLRAAWTLCQIDADSPIAVNALIELLRHEHDSRCKDAFHARQNYKYGENPRYSESFALWKNDPATLSEGLTLESQRTRALAVSMLGNLGPKARAAVPILIELAEGEPDGLNTAALEALLKIDPEAAATADAELVEAVRQAFIDRVGPEAAATAGVK